MKGIELKNLRKKFGLSQDDLAKTLKLARKTISLYENTEVPEDRIQSINDYFALIKDKDVTKCNIEDVIDISTIKKIPFYDVDFYSGFTQIFNDQTIQPSYYFYLPEFHNAELAIKNSGKSMGKELGNDDILGLKQIEGWRDYFPQGEIYAVVTANNLRTIKKVKRNNDNTKLMLIPKPLDEDKFDYPDYEEIPIDMVIALFQVVASTNSKKLAL